MLTPEAEPRHTVPPDVTREILAGEGLSLGQAARRFPSYRQGKPVNPCTIWRWIVDGVGLSDGRRLALKPPAFPVGG